MYKIYILINPINGQVFYVGATRQRLWQRLGQHINEATKRHGFKNKSPIIQTIVDAGKEPEIVEIDKTYEISEVTDLENFYIELFRFYGFTLKQYRSTYSTAYVNNIGDIDDNNWKAILDLNNPQIVPTEEEIDNIHVFRTFVEAKNSMKEVTHKNWRIYKSAHEKITQIRKSKINEEIFGSVK